MISRETLQIDSLSTKLVKWYRTARRPLPWRENSDPYSIWISEVMLQQTTVTAVIPYYLKFLKKFPSLKTLAAAPVETVLEHWAGLGYYSRARNLHKAAQILDKNGGFYRTHGELLKLPGFGDYTARAVSSIAFDERVGVVDGNVIRVLSRVFDLSYEWWRPTGRREYQQISDMFAKTPFMASETNQALMELGATLCTPQSPTCIQCPWVSQCHARANDSIAERPLAKARRPTELWYWQPLIYRRTLKKEAQVFLVQNDYAPFLRGHWIWPGTASLLKPQTALTKKKYTYKGVVTHHQIFVDVQAQRKSSIQLPPAGRWVALKSLKSIVPSSIVRKALDDSLSS